jgi:hypothetical protein
VKDLPPEVMGLAEDSNCYVPLGPGFERIVDDRFILILAPYPGPHGTGVQRLRLRDDTVDVTVEEIRHRFGDMGRTSALWEVSTSATPPGLVERLLSVGMAMDREPFVLGMVLTDEPPPVPDGIEVRRVDRLEEYRAVKEIQFEAFEMPAEEVDDALAKVEQRFRDSRGFDDQQTYLTFVDGEPASAGEVTFTPSGGVLNGGSTVERARGRGAYRALVRARWDAAVERGTPVLVTQAGRMSAPILERLGFRRVAEIHQLVDELPQ